jgi:hypothetical protein
LYAVSAAAAVVAMKFMRERTLQTPLDLGPPLERLLDACWAICFYLSEVFWPTNLAASYPVGDLRPDDAAAWIWPGLIAGLAAAGWLVRRRDQGATLAALAAFVSLLVPVLFVVPQGFFQYSLVADRYLHLPLLAPAALVAAGLVAVDGNWAGGRLRAVWGWVVPGWVAPGWGIGVALLAVLGVSTWRHAADYRNERATGRRRPLSLQPARRSNSSASRRPTPSCTATARRARAPAPAPARRRLRAHARPPRAPSALS